MRTDKLLRELKNGNKEVLGNIYLEYRSEFVFWLRGRYAVPTEQALDLYQQSILVFYENVLKGKLTEISSDIKTYLFAIGKNKMKEEGRYQLRMVNDLEDYKELEHDTEMGNQDREDRILSLRKSFQKLGDHCRELLSLFYYQRLSLDEIVDIHGYKNRNTAKNQKYKCMEKLRLIHGAKKSEIYE